MPDTIQDQVTITKKELKTKLSTKIPTFYLENPKMIKTMVIQILVLDLIKTPIFLELIPKEQNLVRVESLKLKIKRLQDRASMIPNFKACLQDTNWLKEKEILS